MSDIEGQIVIERPVEEVFDFVADERNEPRYNPRMIRAEKTSPGPVGAGTRYQAQAMTMGRVVGMSIEITRYDRPRRLESSTQVSKMEIHGTLTFDPVPSGTLLRWSWDVAPDGLLKLMTPMIIRTGRRQEKIIWADLKRYLESEVISPRPEDLLADESGGEAETEM